MHKLLIVILLLGNLQTLAQIEVMTFNLRYDNKADGENWWGYRKAELATFIQKHHPDILGIQEGLSHQVTYLDSALPGHNYVGVGRDDGKQKGEFAAIFFDTAQFHLLHTQTFWLSETPEKPSKGWDAALPRITTYAALLSRATKDTVHVFNCHYDHMGEKARAESSKLLLQLIAELGLATKSVLVLGDFNSQPNEEPINILTAQLEDSRRISTSMPYGPFGTFNGFGQTEQDSPRIDYVFVLHLHVSKYAVLLDRRANGLYLSDHYPVLVTVEFPTH